MSLLSEIFSWWGGTTWGTRFTLWKQAERVGEDQFGNVYYEQIRGFSPLKGPRRWVIYPKLSDGSQVPAEWYSWLHHTVDTPPTQEQRTIREWHKPHLMNMTGTSQAYRPPGSVLTPETRPEATGDYSAWKPE